MRQPLPEIIARLEKISGHNDTAKQALKQLALAVSDDEKTEIINRLINEAYEFIQRVSIWMQILEKHYGQKSNISHNVQNRSRRRVSKKGPARTQTRTRLGKRHRD